MFKINYKNTRTTSFQTCLGDIFKACLEGGRKLLLGGVDDSITVGYFSKGALAPSVYYDMDLGLGDIDDRLDVGGFLENGAWRYLFIFN